MLAEQTFVDRRLSSGMPRLRAALYVRISDDKAGGGLGVARQEEDCRALARGQGWEVASVHVDNDASAYSGKPRPGYERLLAEVADGAIDVVVAWHPDRLHRGLRDLEDFIDLLDRSGTTVRTVRGGDYDLATPAGRMAARIVGAVARGESEHRSERIARKMEELAQRGRFTGGGRTFGFDVVDGALVVNAAEAELIRAAAAQVLSGHSWGTVARDWNARGVRTARGGQWRIEAVRDLLVNPRLAGLATYKGEVLGAASWSPIIGRDIHEQLTAVSLQRGNGRRGTRSGGRSRLLSGFLWCSHCDRRVIGGRNNNGTLIYRCANRPGDPGCQRTIVGSQTDDYVRDVVLASLAGPGLAKARAAANGTDSKQAEITKRLAADEAALEQLATDHYVDRLIGRAEFLSARELLERRIADSRQRLRPETGSSALSRVPRGSEATLHHFWLSAGLDTRRAVLAAVLDKVVLGPAAKRGQRWSPQRLKPIWRV